MRCVQCRSFDLHPSHRNELEQVLSLIFPLRPYRCMECHHRALGLARPVFNKARTISASVLALVVVLFFSNVWVQLVYNPTSGPMEKSGSPMVGPITVEVPFAITQGDQENPLASELSKDLNPPDGQPLQSRVVPSPPETMESPKSTPAGAGVVVPLLTGNTTEPGESVEPTRHSPEKSALGEGIISAFDVEAEDAVLTARIKGKGPFGRVKSYFLSDPDRLSVQIKGGWDDRAILQRVYPVDNRLVKQIRLGKHGDHFRVVFDLKPRLKVVPDIKWSQAGLSIILAQP